MKIRNRLRVVLIGAVIVLTAGLASAGEKIPPLEIVHGSVGGTWQMISGTIADLLNSMYEGRPVSSIPGAGGVGNVSRVGEGKSEIGMSYAPFLKAGVTGVDPYKRKYENLRAVGSLISNQSHILVSEDLGISSIADLKAKKKGVKIGTGPVGSTEEFTMMLALKYEGISAADIRQWGGRIDLQGTEQRTNGWKDRHMDMINFFINAPAGSVTELMTIRPGIILSLSGAMRKRMADEWGYVPMEIGANSYPKQASVVRTVGLPIVLITTDKASESLIYNLTKVVAENKERLIGAHPAFKQWDPKGMISGLGIQLHPGAAKYYKEKGWM
jgi:hypothetical protein